MYHLWLLPSPWWTMFGFLGRPTSCFEARPPWAVSMCPLNCWVFQCKEVSLNSTSSPLAPPFLISSLLSANTKWTPLTFLYCAIPNFLSTETVSSYNTRILSHWMMLKNFSYFCSYYKTFPTASAPSSTPQCQQWSIFLALSSALIYPYTKAEKWNPPSACRGSRHQKSCAS